MGETVPGSGGGWNLRWNDDEEEEKFWTERKLRMRMRVVDAAWTQQQEPEPCQPVLRPAPAVVCAQGPRKA